MLYPHYITKYERCMRWSLEVVSLPVQYKPKYLLQFILVVVVCGALWVKQKVKKGSWFEYELSRKSPCRRTDMPRWAGTSVCLPHMCIHVTSPIPDGSYPAAQCLTCTVSLWSGDKQKHHFVHWKCLLERALFCMTKPRLNSTLGSRFLRATVYTFLRRVTLKQPEDVTLVASVIVAFHSLQVL